MTKNRLVIIYWNLGIGGIQKRIRDIVLDISKNRPEWEIYILVRNQTEESFESQLPHRRNVHVQTYPFDKKTIRPPIGFVFWLIFKYIQLRAQVIVTFLPHLAITLVGIRQLVFWVRSSVVINDGVVLTKYLSLRGLSWLKPIITRAYNYADRIIVPTRACRHDLQDHYSIDPRRISVIPNWTLMKKHKPLRSIYDVLYVGRFDAEKNVLAICDIMKKVKYHHPELKALLVGSGDLLVQLQNKILADHLDNNIVIKMFNTKVFIYMKRSKILILPSANEGMPNVVLEAAMCQVPSVVNNFIGAEEVVIHAKTGYVYKSVTEAADCIHKLLMDEHRRRRIGLHAQRRVAANYSYATQKRFIDMLLS